VKVYQTVKAIAYYITFSPMITTISALVVAIFYFGQIYTILAAFFNNY